MFSLLPTTLMVVALASLGAATAVEAAGTGELGDVARLLPGQTLVLRPGLHQGAIVVTTPHVTIDGAGKAVIDAGREGTVVEIQASGVTVKNLTIRGSGDSTTHVNAGVRVSEVRDVRLANLTINDALFGIEVLNSRKVTIESCEISSRGEDVTLRGDAIRIWSSKNIDVLDNYWHDARDAVAWYSTDVLFENNRAVNSRYSIHSMFSNNLTVRNNFFEGNSVGIFLMYGGGATILNNEIRRSTGAAGIGLGLKETSNIYAEGNAIVYCASGIVVDNAPWEPNTKNWFHDNLLAFNQRGILLANDREGNQFLGNVLRSNAVDVDTEDRRTSPSIWKGNYWENYEGFDRDGDGIGDTPYEPRKFGDLLIGTHPSAQFFSGAPVLAMVNVIERLVPLTEPLLLLSDDTPHVDEPDRSFGRKDTRDDRR